MNLPVRIVVLDRLTLGPAVRFRRPQFAHEWVEWPATQSIDMAPRVANANVVITNKVPIDRATIDNNTSLQLIAVAATGFDVVDTAAARRRSVDVVNVRNYANDSVPEHTLAMLLALVRQLPAYRQSIQRDTWQSSEQFCVFDAPIRTLAGKTMGLVGFGSLARGVAALAKAFGMRVIVATPRPDRSAADIEFVALPTLLASADFVSLHCPLTAATERLIDAKALARMKRGAILLNTARGALLDEQAVATALCDGRLGGLGIDVLSSEPPSGRNPLLALANRPNVVVTPHIAWAADEAMQRLADQLTDLLEAWHAGHPRHVVN
ncbi:MAG: D-2-hydroxyacid dehydrogenase [Pseudomonadota bacterium]